MDPCYRYMGGSKYAVSNAHSRDGVQPQADNNNSLLRQKTDNSI